MEGDKHDGCALWITIDGWDPWMRCLHGYPPTQPCGCVCVFTNLYIYGCQVCGFWQPFVDKCHWMIYYRKVWIPFVDKRHWMIYMKVWIPFVDTCHWMMYIWRYGHHLRISGTGWYHYVKVWIPLVDRCHRLIYMKVWIPPVDKNVTGWYTWRSGYHLWIIVSGWYLWRWIPFMDNCQWMVHMKVWMSPVAPPLPMDVCICWTHLWLLSNDTLPEGWTDMQPQSCLCGLTGLSNLCGLILH